MITFYFNNINQRPFFNLLEIINTNIAGFNDYNIIDKELELVKTEFEKLKFINETPDNFKKIIQILIDKNDNLEKLLNDNNKELVEIKNILKLQKSNLKNNIGENLKTIGPRIQKINPETLQLIKVYETMSECLIENEFCKRSSINKAINDNTIYNNFRWNFVQFSFKKFYIILSLNTEPHLNKICVEYDIIYQMIVYYIIFYAKCLIVDRNKFCL